MWNWPTDEGFCHWLQLHTYNWSTAVKVRDRMVTSNGIVIETCASLIIVVWVCRCGATISFMSVFTQCHWQQCWQRCQADCSVFCTECVAARHIAPARRRVFTRYMPTFTQHNANFAFLKTPGTTQTACYKGTGTLFPRHQVYYHFTCLAWRQWLMIV